MIVTAKREKKVLFADAAYFEGFRFMADSDFSQMKLKRTIISVFVFIFIIICIILLGFQIISHSKNVFNGSVVSLAYVVIMVIQLCNWTF